MSVLYITEQGSSIKKLSERLIIEKDDLELLEIPVRKTEKVVIFGNVQISSQALAMLAWHGVTVTFLYMDGRIKGQFLPFENINLDLRHAQYNCFADESERLSLAKTFVKEKIEMMYSVLSRQKRNSAGLDYTVIEKNMLDYIQSASFAPSHEYLLGIEGSATRYYWENYGLLFKRELRFNGRTKRPPLDEVNAMLSFGYALLLNLINGMTIGAGLDPYIGFLHKPAYNRSSLPLDILEVFRSQIVDDFVLQSANQSLISKADFMEKDDYPYHLTEDGLKKYLKHWNLMMKEKEYGVIKMVKAKILDITKYIRAVGSKDRAA